MRTTRDHEPILRVLEAAGVQPIRIPISLDDPKSGFVMPEEEEKIRITERQKNLEKLRERKGLRRRLGVSGELRTFLPVAGEERVIAGAKENEKQESGNQVDVQRKPSKSGSEISWGMFGDEVSKGYWRKGLEHWDVIVDKYGQPQGRKC
jgi:hypothetical protein